MPLNYSGFILLYDIPYVLVITVFFITKYAVIAKIVVVRLCKANHPAVNAGMILQDCGGYMQPGWCELNLDILKVSLRKSIQSYPIQSLIQVVTKTRDSTGRDGISRPIPSLLKHGTESEV